MVYAINRTRSFLSLSLSLSHWEMLVKYENAKWENVSTNYENKPVAPLSPPLPLPPSQLPTRFSHSQPYHVLGHKQSHVHVNFTVCTVRGSVLWQLSRGRRHIELSDGGVRFHYLKYPPFPLLFHLLLPRLRCKINGMGKHNKATKSTTTKKDDLWAAALHKSIYN